MKHLLSLAILIGLSAGWPAFAATGGPDDFGYTWMDSDEHPSVAPGYDWVSPTAASVEILGEGDANPGVVINLDPPVVFYGRRHDQMMVSKNGYVTFTPGDVGDDASSDCPFPAVPSKDSIERIAVLHDNLDFGLPIERGRITHEYMPAEAHPHHRCGAHVITWKNMVHAGDLARFDFQLLLFDNFDILMQFGANPENGSNSSTGLQDTVAIGAGVQGLKVACDFAGSVPDEYAVLFEPPTEVVDLTTDGENPAAGQSLREAWIESKGGTKVVFDVSLDGATITRDPALDPLGSSVSKLISIDASGLLSGITLSGDNEAPICTVNKVCHFSNVRFESARSNPDPDSDFASSGAIVLTLPPEGEAGVVATLADCEFVSNETKGGAAIRLNPDSKIWMANTSFTGNQSTEFEGGAIKMFGNSDLNAYRCQFSENSVVGDGGGALAVGADCKVSLVECDFSENSAIGGGAIVFESAGDVSIVRCLFEENSANVGGAIRLFNTSPSIENSTFSGNVGTTKGSVIYATEGGAIAVSHSTFADNNGKAFYAEPPLTVTLSHCILTDVAESPNYFAGGAIIASGGHNLADVNTQLDSATDVNSTEPLLGRLAFNGGATKTHALPAGSPAVDAGGSAGASAPETDGRGYNREEGGALDIGAYEFVGGLVVTTVDDELVTPGTGLSLREAIRDSSPGAQVTFSAALNGESIVLGSRLFIDSDLVLDASSLSAGVAIDGGGAVGLVEVRTASVAIDNIDFRNGFVPDSLGGAGGIDVVFGASLSFLNSSVRGCSSSGAGGGIRVVHSEADIIDSVVAGNETRMTDGDGAGLYGFSSVVTIRGTTIIGNESTGKGAGIAMEDSSLTLTRSTIARNVSAEDGGGLHAIETGGTISGSTFSGNEAADEGGALFLNESPPQITHCTIAGNRAANTAGGIAASGLIHADVGHTIFAGNQIASIRSFDQDAEPRSLGYNLLDDNSWTNQDPTDMEERVAYLAPLADNGGEVLTHATLAISPAINAGSPSPDSPPAKDARGFDRIADGRIDIGAHEAMAPVRVATLDDDLDGVFPRSLRDALLDVGEGGRIVFNRALDGGTIDLSTSAGGQGARLVIDRKVQIDATRLPKGITISSGGDTGVFDLLARKSASLHAVSIAGGRAGSSQDGGAVRVGNGSALLLTNASLTDNRARNGGAIHAKVGGSVHLQNVTLSGNRAQLEGGALGLAGATSSAVIEHCTVTDNDSSTGGTGGVDIGLAKVSFYSSIIAANPGGSVSLDGSNLFTSRGYNINDDAGAFVAAQFTATGDQSITAPNLNVLAGAGGWALIHGVGTGPALGAGDPDAVLLCPIDARGFSRTVNGMEVGAFEKNGAVLDGDSDGMPDYWEQRYGFDIADAGDASGNADGDAFNNLLEFDNGTHPLVSDAPPEPPGLLSLTNTLGIYWQATYSVTAGIDYVAQYSEDLESWETTDSFTGAPDGFYVLDFHTFSGEGFSASGFFRVGQVE